MNVVQVNIFDLTPAFGFPREDTDRDRIDDIATISGLRYQFSDWHYPFGFGRNEKSGDSLA